MPLPGYEPNRYNFEFLATEFLPFERSEIKEWKSAKDERDKEKLLKRGNSSTLLGPTSLNWARVMDLRTLMSIRKSKNGDVVPNGQRDLFLFWMTNFLMLSKATTPQLMYSEAAVLAKEIDPSWGYRSQELSTVYSKAVKFSQGESVEYNGRKYPPLYTPKNDTLISLFEITPTEMDLMRTIISKDEAKRRDRLWHEAKRRANGEMERADYLANAANRKAQALTLREKSLSYRAIAEEMGVSVASVAAYLKTST